MKETINEAQFVSGFMQGQYKNNFSYEGLRCLYEYLTQLEEDMDDELNYDIVVIACDFNEYENAKEFNDYYDLLSREDYDDDDDFKKDLEEEIINHTTLIKFDDDLDDGFIVGVF